MPGKTIALVIRLAIRSGYLQVWVCLDTVLDIYVIGVFGDDLSLV